MNDPTKRTCSAIPPHMLRHAANEGDPESRHTARTTLEGMRELATRRERTLIQERNTATQAPSPSKHRNVYDAQHHSSLPGRLVLSEGGKRSADVEVNEAYDGSGDTWDFFYKAFGWNSIDGKGLHIDSTVHYGSKFDNAMWDGRQMIYGDGDGKLFNRFTAALDVIGHELSHGFTQHTAGLGYSNQTGALNEHVSDAFGIMVKQSKLGQTAAQSDWLIGAGILAAGVKGKGIRSMSAPGTAYDDPNLGKDPQPAHMRNYVHTTQDNGGVHINSGIPNHAFYLAAVAAGGFAWEGVGRVWFQTLKTAATQNVKFAQFAKDTVRVAGQIFGTKSAVQEAVAGGWEAVGVRATRSTPSRPVILVFTPPSSSEPVANPPVTAARKAA
jgi:Zn-dependent metalloprotease